MGAIIGYILIIVVVTTIISLGSNAERNRKLKERIVSCWGKDADEKLSSDDLKTIAEYFNNRKEDEICVAATHDVELTYILEKYFSNYHFEEKIIDNQITFDYLVHQGRSNTQNAIKLLGILGYSDIIVKKAEEKATKFLKDGVWEVE